MQTEFVLLCDHLNKIGLDVSRYEDNFLYQSIEKRVVETGCDSVEAYYMLLKQNNHELNFFFDSLHNSYSEFFRNPITFSVLERIILPMIIQKKHTSKQKEIRIWSAATASGQEAYSLAILFEELMNRGKSKLKYRIFATDQLALQLQEAQKGIYAVSALNHLTMMRVDQWFDKQGDMFAIKPELKKHIDFSVFDLFSEQLGCPPNSIYGDFDIVICANLLFYYKPVYRTMILKKASNCLAHGGFIIVGEVERDMLINENYQEVFPQSGIFQKK